MSFKGAKLLLFLGPQLLVILRDQKADIPFPGYWDFPGGGREGDETAQACALRETREEVGLIVPKAAIHYSRRYPRPDGATWFFAAEISARSVDDIRFGDEGQCWDLMNPDEYAAHPLGIPRFKVRLQDYLQSCRGGASG